MHATVILALVATTLAAHFESLHIGEPNTGASRGHGNSDPVSGDCCAVWDTSRNTCLEGTVSQGYGKTCHRFDGPPKAGSPDAVPKDCYIWRFETHTCLERAENEVSDGRDEPKGGPDIHNGGGHHTVTVLPTSFITVFATMSA